MFDILKNIISKIDADYVDLRYEIMRETKIILNGREIYQIGTNTGDGFVLRVLKNGGFSSISFTKKEDAEKAIKTVLENVNLMAKSTKKPVRFAKAEVIKDTFIPPLREDPRNISIEEKLEIVKNYNNIPLKHENVTTNIQYTEVIREKYFINSEGTEIREDLITTNIYGSIISYEGNVVQNVRVGIGGSDGFYKLRNREEEFEKKTKLVLDLLKAEPVKGGVYNVILNPNLTGVFTHEAFGHFSEADLIEDVPSMRERMKIGAQLGNEILTIIDDPTMPNQLGFYKYDDEGVRARRTYLLKNGVLVGRLHSRRTAEEFGESLTGHCVAEDYRYPPIIRMGNIFIEPGNSTFEELLEKLGDGLYILDSKGGQTAGENFTFGAQYAYEVKNGKIGKLLRDINISGNLYQTLKDIYGIGNDFVLGEVGGCGKGQLNIRSSYGGPHILIKNVVVGGV
ncbi:MAG: TldD/PmbA family protein [Dictyoglomus sp.]|nr:TldD/PmbA family protein [Dictyoglomus sp.]MDW8188880.1 TldD/PmbA family protein [Dictyoglomus sp.]